MMTREEAIIIIERVAHTEAKWPGTEDTLEALDMAVSALRPVTREQVEKMRGMCSCSKPKACCTCCSMRCQDCIGQSEYRQAAFCMKCGRPLTDEALDMVMERMKELK